MTKYIIIVIAIVFAVVRFTMPAHALSMAGTYEAFAHLFVGGLTGAAIAAGPGDIRRYCGWTAAALSAVEVVAFIAGRRG